MKPEQLIPPQVAYLRGLLTLPTRDQLCDLGRPTLAALMELWADQGEAGKAPLERLKNLHLIADEWLPILPCLRTIDYVQQGSMVNVYIADPHLSPTGQACWTSGTVTIAGWKASNAEPKCQLTSNEADVNWQAQIRSPHLLTTADAEQLWYRRGHYRIIANWVRGFDPQVFPNYDPDAYHTALNTRKK